MVRKRARVITLIKLSPLYLLVAAILYILIFAEKDFDYLEMGKDRFTSGRYPQALDYFDAAVEKKRYRGSALLEVYMLRARTLNIMKAYSRALEDLDMIIQLSPHSEEAAVARSMKGDIYIGQQDYNKAIEAFEYLAAETDIDDEKKTFEFRSKAGAAAYNSSNLILDEASDILARNLDGYSEELELLTQYTFDLHNDYELDAVREKLERRLTESLINEIADLIVEAKRQYRYAFNTLESYISKPFSNPVAAVFLVNILYRSNRHFPALLEATLATKGALPSSQRLELLQIMAEIFEETGAYEEAAETHKKLLAMQKNRSAIPSIRRKIIHSYLKAEEYDRVIEEANPLLHSGFGDLLISYCLGRAYQEKRDFKRAKSHLSMVVQAINRGHAPPYVWNSPVRDESIHQLLAVYLRLNERDNALNLLNNSIEILPNDVELRRARATLFDETLETSAAASKDYLYLLKNDRRDSAIFEKWYQAQDAIYTSVNGLSYRERAIQLVDKYDRMVRLIGDNFKLYDQLYEASTFPEAHDDITLRVAIIYELLDRDRRQEGKRALRMLVRNNPEHVELIYRLGLLYYEEGEFALALNEFEKVLEHDPFDLESIKRVLRCLRQLSDAQGEAVLIRSILDLDDHFMTRWLLAWISFEEGRYDNYLRMYSSLDQFPEDMSIDLNLMAAACHIKNDAFEEAAQLTIPILTKDPRNLDALGIWAQWLVACPKEDRDRLLPPMPESESKAELDTGTDAEETVDPVALEETGAENGIEEVETEVFPEAFREAGALMVYLFSQGSRLCPCDLEVLAESLIENKRPDLLLFLLQGIELSFPLTPPIYRAQAMAYQMQGRFEEAADTLVSHATSLEDLRWAQGLALFSENLSDLSRRVHDRHQEIGGVEEKEFFLRAAACAALTGGIPEADQNLDQALRRSGRGAFTAQECEFVDYLTIALKRFFARKQDISIDEVPEPEAPEEGAEDDLQNGEDAEPADQPGDSLLEHPAFSDIEVTEADLIEEPASSDLLMSDTSGRGRRFQKGGDRQPPRGQRKDGKGGKEKKQKPDPARAAAQIVLNKIPMSDRYKEIVPEAIYLHNEFNTPEPEDVVFTRAMLKHILLRNIPELQAECLAAAEKVQALKPTCGQAVRYLLENKEKEPPPEERLDVLTPVIDAVPGDYESLCMLAQTYAEMNLDRLLMLTLEDLSNLRSDPREVSLIAAEIYLNRQETDNALQIFRSILEEATVADTRILQDLLPLLVRAGAGPEINKTITLFLEAEDLPSDLIDTIHPYLVKAPFDEETVPLLERLLPRVFHGQRAHLISILARAYYRMSDAVKLEELADELLRMIEDPARDREELYLALKTVGNTLRLLGETERSIEIVEKQFYLHPDRADALEVLAETASAQDQVRRAATYRNLYYFLRPWEARNTVRLAKSWFHELGECGKAFEIIRTSHGAMSLDPESVSTIMIGYRFMIGKTLKAINEGFKTYVKEKTKYPSILFLIASLYYSLDQLPEAQRLYTMLYGEFPDDEMALRCKYLVKQIEAQIQEAENRRKARRSGAKEPSNETEPSTEGSSEDGVQAEETAPEETQAPS